MIVDGTAGDGDLLPSVRKLAAEYNANPLTVAKAYQTFQDEGLVVVKRGVGMFVAQGARAKLSAAERKEFLENLLARCRGPYPPSGVGYRGIGSSYA